MGVGQMEGGREREMVSPNKALICEEMSLQLISAIKPEILNGPLYFLQDPLFNMGRLGFVGQRGGD